MELLQTHLGIELEWPTASPSGINGEVGGFVDNATKRFKPRPITPDLRARERGARDREGFLEKGGDGERERETFSQFSLAG